MILTVKNLIYFTGQRFSRKWFADEVYAIIPNTPVGDDIGSVAGHEEDF